MSITITQLHRFLAVVRSGSITSVADELVVTQPSVSASLSALSRELGVDLLQRAGRGVELSPAGEAFVPYATDVIGLLEQGGHAAREAAAATARRLRLAAVTTAAESLVPPLMRAFSSRRPDVELTLAVGNREHVLDLVLSHRADAAIAGRPPEAERLVVAPLMPNEIALITAPDDPLAQRRSVPVPALAGRPWLLREPGSGTRMLNEDFLSDAGLRPETLTLGSNGAIKQAARAGLGVSLVSRVAVELELGAGLLATVAIDRPPAPRSWYALRSAVGPLRDPVAAFMEFAVSAQAREVVTAAAGVQL